MTEPTPIPTVIYSDDNVYNVNDIMISEDSLGNFFDSIHNLTLKSRFRFNCFQENMKQAKILRPVSEMPVHAGQNVRSTANSV